MKNYLLFIAIFYGNFAFGQLNETFVTNSGIWTGSNSGNDFVIVNEQLRSNPVTAAEYYLSTANSLAVNCEWKFSVNLQFNPSGANYVDVYLTSDQPNLQAANINGYYIRLGNTEDEISLYKRSGAANTSVKIIDGADGLLNKTNNSIKIRATRTINGTFTLKRDATGTGYFTEGSVLDAGFSTSAYFGIFIKQSSAASVIQKHFFDDIIIAPVVSDNVPPEILSAKAIDSLTIELTFDESIDSVSAKNHLNYEIDKHIGNPVSVKTTTDAAKYILKLAKGLNTNLYQLTASNIKDNSGNIIITSNTASFTYVTPFIAKTGDLVINEIFADPAPQIDLPSVEFIELYNTTSQTIHLKNWKYSDPTSTANFPVDSINAGEYLILCAKADTNEFKSYGKSLGISPWPSLNNSSDIIKLISPESKTIDSVSYSDSWHTTATKKQGGWSLERIDYASVCTDLFNWTSSADISGGTPGKQNSAFISNYDKVVLKADSMQRLSDSTITVYFNKPVDMLTPADAFNLSPASGNIKSASVDKVAKQVKILFSDTFKANTTYTFTVNQIKDCAGNLASAASFQFTTPKLPALRVDTAKIYITEIFADPSPEVGLPLVEFIEIYNPGKDTIDLNGWALNDPTTKSTLKTASILPQQYLILCPAADTLQYKAFGKTIGLAPWPSLNNTAEQISLKSYSGRLVDSVFYKYEWHSSASKKQGGWSLEKIDYTSDCAGLFNWTSSTDLSGGTPGKVNSVFSFDFVALKTDSVKILSDKSLKVYFNKPVSVTSPENAFTISPAAGMASSSFDTSLTQATITFESAFGPNTHYNLNISKLTDCTGHLIEPYNFNFNTPMLPPVRVDTARILITEIFADPSPEVGLPLAEFVEIFNPGKDTVDLTGWTFNDPTTKSTLKTAFILPQQYIILCPAADTVHYKLKGKTIGLSPWPSLNNTAEQITLKSFKERLVDSVSYTDEWYRNSDKKTGGWSLETVNYQSFCSGIQNWIASNDPTGGTPGRPNSVNDLYSIAQLKVTEAMLKDSVTITVKFNRPPDIHSTLNTDNYLVNNGLGKPTTASMNLDLTELDLKFEKPISRGFAYRITSSNITDCEGKPISTDNYAEFFYPHKILRTDILISEVLFNPRIEGADFVEIYNNSNNVLDLKELSIAAIKAPDSIVSRKNISTTPLLLQPKSYMVLSTDPDNIKTEYHTENPDAFLKMPSMPAFNNDAGTVLLISGNSRIDQLSYNEKMHFSLIKDPKGVSLERSNFNVPANEIGNFRSSAASAGYATPGYKNSQFVETAENQNAEVSLLSKTFSPDNDGFEDALQIDYRFAEAGLVSNISVYNDKGALIRRLAKNVTITSEGSFFWDGLAEDSQKANVGIYIVTFEVFNLNGNVKKFRKPCVLAAKLD